LCEWCDVKSYDCERGVRLDVHVELIFWLFITI